MDGLQDSSRYRPQAKCVVKYVCPLTSGSLAESERRTWDKTHGGECLT
jgi:hypothetical protein